MDWKQLLAAILPSILQMLEIAFAKKIGQVLTGPTKNGAAVNMAQNALLLAAASPNIVTVEEATNIPAIRDFVDSVVKSMKDEGKLGGHKIKLETPKFSFNFQTKQEPKEE